MFTCHCKYSTLVLHSISTLYSILYSSVWNQLSLYSCSLSVSAFVSAWPEPMQGINAWSPCHWIQSVSTSAGLTSCPVSVPPLHLFPSGLDWTLYWSRPRLDKLKELGSTSFILWESLIGHLAKSTSRANTVLSWKVNLQEALHMFLHMSEDFLWGVPESLVHNIIVDFAHRGNIDRSNCLNRSNPKNNMAIIFWVWPRP